MSKVTQSHLASNCQVGILDPGLRTPNPLPLDSGILTLCCGMGERGLVLLLGGAQTRYQDKNMNKAHLGPCAHLPQI